MAIRVFRVNRVKEASQACLACLATLAQEDPRVTEVTLGTKACQEWGFRDPWDQEGCQVYRGHRVQAHREPQEREGHPVLQVNEVYQGVLGLWVHPAIVSSVMLWLNKPTEGQVKRDSQAIHL